MKLFKRKKKDFINNVMKSARKEKDGTLATRIMNQFIQKTELKKPPEKKRIPEYFGHKAARLANKGRIGLSHRHGIVGQAIADTKRDRILASKMKG